MSEIVDEAHRELAKLEQEREDELPKTDARLAGNLLQSVDQRVRLRRRLTEVHEAARLVETANLPIYNTSPNAVLRR